MKNLYTILLRLSERSTQLHLLQKQIKKVPKNIPFSKSIIKLDNRNLIKNCLYNCTGSCPIVPGDQDKDRENGSVAIALSTKAQILIKKKKTGLLV